MPALELRRVVKTFGNFKAVDDLTLSVERGRTIALLGPSGCGKTTTLRLIAGFEQPDEGELLIESSDMRGKRPYERNVGLLFQDYALFPHMTVEENVGFGLRYRNRADLAINRRVQEMLDLVQMSAFSKRRPISLSGGQQQRVALARALATRPHIMLLDEPLSALDAKLRQELRIEIRSILRKVGSTTIIVTHDQEEAMSLGERIVVMEAGRIVQYGTPEEIYAAPKTRFVADFVGRANWFTGSFGERLPDGNWIFRSGSRMLIVSAGPDCSSSTYEACVRPERIAVCRTTRGSEQFDTTTINCIEGTVSDAVYLGSELHFMVEIGPGVFITAIEKNMGQSPTHVGEQVSLCFRPQDVVLVSSERTPTRPVQQVI